MNYIIYQTSAAGKRRWIASTDPLKWTFTKKKATKFKDYKQALEYIKHMGIEFYTISEI